MEQPCPPKATRHYRSGTRTADGSFLIGSLTLLTLSDQSRRLTAADSMADKMHRKELKLLNSLRHCVEQGKHKEEEHLRSTHHNIVHTDLHTYRQHRYTHTYTHHDHYNYSLHYILFIYIRTCVHTHADTYVHTFMTATKCKRCFSLPFLSSERSRSTVLVLGRGRREKTTRNRYTT